MTERLTRYEDIEAERRADLNTELGHLRAEVERLTRERDNAITKCYDLEKQVSDQTVKAKTAERERDDALALNSINECGANNALGLLEDMKTFCEVHKARADAAEHQVATLREALLKLKPDVICKYHPQEEPRKTFDAALAATAPGKEPPIDAARGAE